MSFSPDPIISIAPRSGAHPEEDRDERIWEPLIVKGLANAVIPSAILWIIAYLAIRAW